MMALFAAFLTLFSLSAWGADSCACVDSSGVPITDAGLKTPAPSFAEVQDVTTKLTRVSRLADEITADRLYGSVNDKTRRFEQCVHSNFADVARFMQVKDITDISYNAYLPWISSFFDRHTYSVHDVYEVLNSTRVGKELAWQRTHNPELTTRARPMIVPVRPCEWTKYVDAEHAKHVAGFFDESSNTVYVDACKTLREAVVFVAHELTHAYLANHETAEMHARNKTTLGRIGLIVDKGGPGAYLADRNRVRYDEEYRAYIREARVDHELENTYPGLGDGVSNEACGDTGSWMSWWQRFEGISGAGYPKTYGPRELASLHREIGCRLTPGERALLGGK